MRMRPAESIVIAIVALSFLFGIYFYDRMPAQMASHWNVRNEVDGYMSRFWGLFFMPIIALGLSLLFIAIPRIDPLRHNIERFRLYFDSFIVVLFLFLFYLYLVTILWNNGRRFVLIQALAPAFAILFFFLRRHVRACEDGTGSSASGRRGRWRASGCGTRRTGSEGACSRLRAYCASARFRSLGYAIYFILVPILLAVAFAVVYSYREYQREMKSEGAPRQ